MGMAKRLGRSRRKENRENGGCNGELHGGEMELSVCVGGEVANSTIISAVS